MATLASTWPENPKYMISHYSKYSIKDVVYHIFPFLFHTALSIGEPLQEKDYGPYPQFLKGKFLKGPSLTFTNPSAYVLAPLTFPISHIPFENSM